MGLAPKKLVLEQNYPNPFNPSTKIGFTLPENGKVVLKVYNVLGQELATLFNDEAEAGRLYQVEFNASQLPSGMYFSLLHFGKEQLLRRMLLLK